MSGVSSIKGANVDDPTGNRRRRGHSRACKVGPDARSLAVFKIPVAGRDAALARLAQIAISARAHRAARLVPLKSRRTEYLVETGLFGLSLDGG